MASLQEQIYYHSPVWLQNLLVSAYGYRLYRKRYTGVFHEIRALLREARAWDRQQIEAWQSEKLHNMIRHCRQTVPYYQQLFADYGLHENDFTSVKDVQKLPILSKATLRENNDAFRSSSGKAYMVQHTSGSTGTPLALEVNEYTYKLAMALVVDHEEYHGVPFGARRATFAGRMVQPADDMRAPFSRYNRAENQKLYSSYHLNEKTFPAYRKDLDRFAPKELIGYPSAISTLAMHYIDTGERPSFSPRTVITNSETLLSWQREKIEHVFQCPVFDYYGTAEYVAFTGQDNSGLYVANPIIGILEVVTNDQVVKHTGTLTATSLTNTAMPLLRYQLGDTAITADSSIGPVQAIREITGRVDDYIITPDGRSIGRIDHLFKGLSEIREAQVIQDRTNHCTVRVVTADPLSIQGRKILSSNITSRLGTDMMFDIQEVSSIRRGANGKFKSVIKEI